MVTYRIGTPAANIVAVQITLDGTIIPIIRHRLLTGDMVDVPGRQYRPAYGVAAAEFVVSVERGHAGVVELVPPKREFVYSRTVIPLGSDKPFLDNELPPSPGANGAFSFSESVAFRFADHVLSWKAENMSGRAVLNELYPELSIVLRLPPGRRGAVTFNAPIFLRADGTAEHLLTAA